MTLNGRPNALEHGAGQRGGDRQRRHDLGDLGEDRHRPRAGDQDAVGPVQQQRRHAVGEELDRIAIQRRHVEIPVEQGAGQQHQRERAAQPVEQAVDVVQPLPQQIAAPAQGPSSAVSATWIVPSPQRLRWLMYSGRPSADRPR